VNGAGHAIAIAGGLLAPLLGTAVGLVLLAIALWIRERRRRPMHPVPAGHRPEITLPHREAFELHHNALSLCSMKTRVCLAELGIPYRSHAVDLIETGRYENLRPAFLRVNPAGTVPVLVHEGHPVYESHEQIRHLARHAPGDGVALLPESTALRAEMERWIDRSSLAGDPVTTGAASAASAVAGLTVPLFAAMIDRVPAWRILEGLLFHFDRRRPVLFLVLKAAGLWRLHHLRPLVAALARSRAQLAAHLDALEERLADGHGPWLLGADFTLADVSWLVIFERLVQADVLHVFVGDGRRPRCEAYWERLRGRPAYDAAILDHAHPAVVRGTERLRRCKAARPALREALEGRALEPLGGSAAGEEPAPPRTRP